MPVSVLVLMMSILHLTHACECTGPDPELLMMSIPPLTRACERAGLDDVNPASDLYITVYYQFQIYV